MPAVVSTDIYADWQRGAITRAQYDEAKKRRFNSYFITAGGRLVLITQDGKVVALLRTGKVWAEYTYHGKIKKRAFG